MKDVHFSDFKIWKPFILKYKTLQDLISDLVTSVVILYIILNNSVKLNKTKVKSKTFKFFQIGRYQNKTRNFAVRIIVSEIKDQLQQRNEQNKLKCKCMKQH